jgi:hypothetical protein
MSTIPNLMNVFDDFQVVDQLEQVTLFRKQPDGTFDTGTICYNALRREELITEIKDGVYFATQVVTWHIWVADLNSQPPPKIRDVVQDGNGVRWTVNEEVKYSTWRTRYPLRTIQEH